MAKRPKAGDKLESIAQKGESIRLEWRSPSELAENPLNWRRHPPEQVEALQVVMQSVGWAGACLYNETTGRLIDGHARRALAEANGAEKVPVLVGRWTEEQEKAILATLDPIASMAVADGKALDELLAQVSIGSEALEKVLRDQSARAAEAAVADMAAAPGDDQDEEEEEEEEGDDEHKTFSVPLTVVQERDVRRAIKAAKEAAGVETSGEALAYIVKEWQNARST
jgi:hypothetical protein